MSSKNKRYSYWNRTPSCCISWVALCVTFFFFNWRVSPTIETQWEVFSLIVQSSLQHIWLAYSTLEIKDDM